MLKALEILKEKRKICVRIFEGDDYSEGLDYYENKIVKLDEAIAELEALNNRSCSNCKNSSFEIKFGELEFNSCFLVSNSKPCKWEPK